MRARSPGRKSTRKREARTHEHTPTRRSGDTRPPTGRARNTAAATRDRPVRRIAHAHEEHAGRADVERERFVPERRKPPGPFGERLRRAHGVDPPVAAREKPPQPGQTGADQLALARARRVEFAGWQ